MSLFHKSMQSHISMTQTRESVPPWHSSLGQTCVVTSIEM